MNHLTAFVTTGPPADPHHLHALGQSASALMHQSNEGKLFVLAVLIALVYIFVIAAKKVTGSK
jgi:hypothetical protein